MMVRKKTKNKYFPYKTCLIKLSVLLLIKQDLQVRYEEIETWCCFPSCESEKRGCIADNEGSSEE